MALAFRQESLTSFTVCRECIPVHLGQEGKRPSPLSIDLTVVPACRMRLPGYQVWGWGFWVGGWGLNPTPYTLNPQP